MVMFCSNTLNSGIPYQASASGTNYCAVSEGIAIYIVACAAHTMVMSITFGAIFVSHRGSRLERDSACTWLTSNEMDRKRAKARTMFMIAGLVSVLLADYMRIDWQGSNEGKRISMTMKWSKDPFSMCERVLSKHMYSWAIGQVRILFAISHHQTKSELEGDRNEAEVTERAR